MCIIQLPKFLPWASFKLRRQFTALFTFQLGLELEVLSQKFMTSWLEARLDKYCFFLVVLIFHFLTEVLQEILCYWQKFKIKEGEEGGNHLKVLQHNAEVSSKVGTEHHPSTNLQLQFRFWPGHGTVFLNLRTQEKLDFLLTTRSTLVTPNRILPTERQWKLTLNSQQKFCHLEGGWSDHHWNKVPPHWIFHAWVSTINNHASDKSMQHQPLKKLSLESFNKATIRDASWPFLQSSQKPLCCGSFWPGPKTLRSSTSQRPPSRVNHLEQSAVPWGGQLRHFWDKSIL